MFRLNKKIKRSIEKKIPFFCNGGNHTRLVYISCFNYRELRMIEIQTRGFAHRNKAGIHSFIQTCFQLWWEPLSPSSHLKPVTFVYSVGWASLRDPSHQQQEQGTYIQIFTIGRSLNSLLLSFNRYFTWAGSFYSVIFTSVLQRNFQPSGQIVKPISKPPEQTSSHVKFSNLQNI